jgi:cysteinyl-tRNA synthetase
MPETETPISLYNTRTRSKAPFRPIDARNVRMYVCGPTVYDRAHIGNARPVVVFDTVFRLLRHVYGDDAVRYVRNLTDIDDKIIARANASGRPIEAITTETTDWYHADMAALGVLPPTVEPRATAYVPAMVAMIETLIARGHAYAAEGHVLFAVASYPDYGKFARRSLDEMQAGARVEVAPYKRDPGDFVLWKPSPPDLVGWPSPWGRGRPGWHVECSTMVEQHLGDTIDIHGGGQDLIFPHHENEVAQSVCAHGGKLYSRYWLHNGMVDFGTEKMSKSLGNVVLIRDVLARHAGEAVRLALLTAHYRQPLGWGEPLLAEARKKLDRMYGALRDAGISGAQRAKPAAEPPAAVVAALEDDLNTPQALAELFGVVRAANGAADPQERRKLAESLRAGGWLLGLLGEDPAAWFEKSGAAGSGDVDPAEIDSLLKQREAFRKARNFSEADRIRDGLAARGIVIEDVAGGARWRRSKE